MTYDIFNSKATAMPKPAKSTEIVKFLLSKASKYVQKTLVTLLFPMLYAHGDASEFQYYDLIWKEYVAL